MNSNLNWPNVSLPDQTLANAANQTIASPTLTDPTMTYIKGSAQYPTSVQFSFWIYSNAPMQDKNNIIPIYTQHIPIEYNTIFFI